MYSYEIEKLLQPIRLHFEKLLLGLDNARCVLLF
jgi:hypothetical protein